jgi:hypothetical protein
MSEAVQQIVFLSHAGFRMLGEPMFRLSAGLRIPSMVIQLGDVETVLPLRSVAREFHIDLESQDGKMLVLIEQALDFVVAVRLGDKLPSELSGGAASWEPSARDRRVAASRVRLKLLRCVFSLLGTPATVTNGGTPGWEEESNNRKLLEQAIAGAADAIEGMDAADANARIASICEEVAYVESMHRSLTRGLTTMSEKLLRNQDQVPAQHLETIKQVQSLARSGMAEIKRRFQEIDDRLTDFLAVLIDLPPSIAWLRSQRDWLFRTNHAWEPVFNDWASAPKHFDEFFMKVVDRTYVFLAPRFMSVQDWDIRDTRLKQAKVRAKVW